MSVKYSAVATVYNDAENVAQLLDDVCNQTIKPFEFIIADGGSKDSTVEVIREYAKKTMVPIRLLSGERLNISQGFNTAIRNARSDLVLISAVGNRYGSDFAESLLGALSENAADIAYPKISGRLSSDFAKRWYEEIFENGLCCPTGIGMNHGSLVKRSVFERIGMFYEKFHYAGEDQEFMMRAVRYGIPRIFAKDVSLVWDLPQTIGEFRRQHRGYTIAWFQIFSYKILALIFIGSLYHFFPAAIRVLKSGERASLRDWRRIWMVTWFLREWRFLLPEKHVKECLVPRLDEHGDRADD